MAKDILIEEFHIVVSAPSGLADAEYDEIRRTLTDATFKASLRRAVRQVFRREASLNKAKVRLGR